MSKGCELCSINPARMFCDSDEASLCWECDEKVHAANFLVAKHSRTLLCHVCQSPTPWSAAGPNLGRTVSLCHACAPHHQANQISLPQSDVDREYYSDDDDDDDESEDSDEIEDEEEEEEEEEEEDGENQVVPLSECGSSSEENVSSKRSRTESSEDEDGSCSSPMAIRSRIMRSEDVR